MNFKKINLHFNFTHLKNVLQQFLINLLLACILINRCHFWHDMIGVRCKEGWLVLL